LGVAAQPARALIADDRKGETCRKAAVIILGGRFDMAVRNFRQPGGARRQDPNAEQADNWQYLERHHAGVAVLCRPIGRRFGEKGRPAGPSAAATTPFAGSAFLGW